MYPTICALCAQPFDRPLPVCRSVSCEAAVCRFCRDAETGCCLDCVREQASLAAYRAACDARDRDALVGILLAGATISGERVPSLRDQIGGDDAA